MENKYNFLAPRGIKIKTSRFSSAREFIHKGESYYVKTPENMSDERLIECIEENLRVHEKG